MKRRTFLKSSSLYTAAGLFHISMGKVQLVQWVQLDEEGKVDLKKFVLQDYSLNEYSKNTDEQAQNAINTMFWLTLDPDGKMSSREKRYALEARAVTKEDMYKACNFKDTTVEDYAVGAYELTWAGGALALGIVAPPTAAVAIGFFALEQIATGAVSYGLEAKKEAQRNLCSKTIEKYYIAENNVQKFLKKEEIVNTTKIPFDKTKEDIVKALPNQSVVKKAAETAITSASDSEKAFQQLLVKEHEAYEKSLSRFNEFLKESHDKRERQQFIERLDFEEKERQAAIYLSQQLITQLFGSAELGNKFYTLASSLNTIYSTYQKFGLGSSLTFAATANYVGAGLAIASMFQSGKSGSEFQSLFKSIRQLTEIVIEGFNALQKTQVEILRQLQDLSEVIIRQGVIEVALLRSVESKIEAFRADYENDQYTQTQETINAARFNINDLLKQDDFDIRKEIFKARYNTLLAEFVRYGTETAATSRVLSGYTNNFTIRDLVNKFEKMHSFEYLLGTVPMVHRSVGSAVTTFSPAEFERQVPNPLEWSRSFYLYYQAIFATGYEAASVKNHIQAFLEKGRVIKSFVNKYSSGAFIAAVAARHKALATQFIEILNENFKGLLTQNQYYLYEYLLSTVDNSKYTSYKSLYEFSHLADPYANNFVITQVNALVDNKRILGYSTSFNIMKAMKILNKLELLEPHNPVSKVYPHPVINFTLSHSKLKFKNSVLAMVFHNIEPNAHQDFRSTFIPAKDESDVVAIRGGSASADFQRVLKDVNVPENYWKVFPGKRYQEKPAVNKEIDFLDYFRNEIIHAELKKRAKIINELVIRESEILRQNETLVNQLDAMGFLLSSALTLLNYKRQTASTFSYIQRSNGINNSMKPHKPTLAFASDIFANYVGLVSRDVHNDYLPEDSNEKQFWTFKNSFNHRNYAVPTREELNIKEYQLSGYGKGNALNKLDQQTEQLLAIESMDANVGNYNVERIIGEAEAYLKVTSVG